MKNIREQKGYNNVFFSLSPQRQRFRRKNVLSHDGSANSWAELDLNQRRHIANEFTVRPH